MQGRRQLMSDLFGRVEVTKTPLGNGGFILAAKQPLGPYPPRITDHLVKWATADPTRHFLAERDETGAWRYLTYGEALHRARSIGQYLLDSGCGPDVPAASCAENGLDAACFSLGAIYAGIPYAPISPSYVSVPAAFERLRSCIVQLQPGCIYLGSDSYVQTVGRACEHKVPLMTKTGAYGHSLETAARRAPSTVDTYNSSIQPDSVAKYKFTSGSTGAPKAVINTHRMLCANQKQLEAIYPFLNTHAPILVDWLPWHHTFGGNEVFYMAMTYGGTLYIDNGKPVAGAIDTTVQNLKSVSPTIYFNVPLGFDQLVARMETDHELRRMFFAQLQMVFYAGAGMPQRTWSRLEQLSEESVGRQVPVVTAWGATETAPLATGVHFESHRTDNIGVPVPGCEIKFALIDERYELRVRGPNVTPGYLGRPDLNATAFDEDGFFCTGDSGELVDENNPSAGIAFRGRITEDFKLQSGAWVAVGQLRGLLMGQLMPVASHVVVVGENRDCIGLLVFLDVHAARKLAGDDTLSLDELAQHPQVVAHIAAGIERHNRHNTATSVRVERYVVMADNPSAEAREITDKGSINQAAVLQHRAQIIEALFSRVPDATLK